MARRLLALIFALVAVPAIAQVQPSPLFGPQATPLAGISVGVTGSGVVTAPQLLAPDGSASAPSYSFASRPTDGFYSTATPAVRLAITGVERFVWTQSQFFIRSDSGAINLGASDDLTLSRCAANVLCLASGDSFNFGGVTSGDVKLKQSGSVLQARLGDDGGYGAFQGTFSLASGTSITGPGGGLLASASAPTVTSAGTSPSVVANGSASFRVNVGTGGTATTIVMAMPTATTGWNCDAENITAAAANRANQTVKQQSSTTTSVTVQNQTVSTGAALAFTASDIVRFICFAY